MQVHLSCKRHTLVFKKINKYKKWGEILHNTTVHSASVTQPDVLRSLRVILVYCYRVVLSDGKRVTLNVNYVNTRA